MATQCWVDLPFPIVICELDISGSHMEFLTAMLWQSDSFCLFVCLMLQLVEVAVVIIIAILIITLLVFLS